MPTLKLTDRTKHEFIQGFHDVRHRISKADLIAHFAVVKVSVKLSQVRLRKTQTLVGMPSVQRLVALLGLHRSVSRSASMHQALAALPHP